MHFRYLAIAGILVTTAPAVLFAAGPRYGTWGVATEDMNTKVKPGDDFFEYAEGTWLKVHPIPADKTGAGYNYELPDEIDASELLTRSSEAGVTFVPGADFGGPPSSARLAFSFVSPAEIDEGVRRLAALVAPAAAPV